MSLRDEKLSELRTLAAELGHPYNGVCDPHIVAKALLLIAELIEKYALLDSAVPIPVCEHGNMLRDATGRLLAPVCGCCLIG